MGPLLVHKSPTTSKYFLSCSNSINSHPLFGSIKPSRKRAIAIRAWVHEKVTFNYNGARPTKTATDVGMERVGVCRDFQHLAITLSRCMNLPARYVTGHIGDIRQPYSGPGDSVRGIRSSSTGNGSTSMLVTIIQDSAAS